MWLVTLIPGNVPAAAILDKVAPVGGTPEVGSQGKVDAGEPKIVPFHFQT